MKKALALLAGWLCAHASPKLPPSTPCHHPVEVGFTAEMDHPEPFRTVTLDVAFTDPAGVVRTVPGFWDGGNQWKVRYASGLPGRHGFRSRSSATGDAGLHGVEGVVVVEPGPSDNPLFRHGPIRVAGDRQHFEHADGTPFFWLADTWWKCLSRRMSLEDFQELTADRKRKGFTAVQIVCGPYPDEDMMEPRWANEGGLPYTTRDFREANPRYFAFAEQRIGHLVESGIVPVMVGGWGRPQGGGRSTLEQAGLEGFQRHWRHLIARFGAWPVVWVVGGETRDEYGPWSELGRFVQRTDPHRRPLCYHSPAHPRRALKENDHFDFDMVGIGHMGFQTAAETRKLMRECLASEPRRPALCGEACYESHMQTNFPDVQRHLFWSLLLSGAAGHTYGAAGVWQASVEGDPGITPVYDWTTWREGMALPGSTQVGLGKALLVHYPWAQFEPHPEWTDPGAFAAGIPGRVRVIYQPSRGIYKWDGARVNGLEPGVPYRAFYFDPVSGRRHDLGAFLHTGAPPMPFTGHQQPLQVDESFDAPAPDAWQDAGTPTLRERGRLVGGKGLLSLCREPAEADLMASVEARGDAEAGIVLRYQNPGRYLVALYSPLLKAIFLHDRQNGEWGPQLGRVDVPDAGPHLRLTAAACGEWAALVLHDGERVFATPAVRVTNREAGPTGLWLYQIGDRQEFDRFQASRTPFQPSPALVTAGDPRPVAANFTAPNVPSPQDWVLVLERSPSPESRQPNEQ